MIADLIAQHAPDGDNPGDEGSRQSVLVLLALARHGRLSDTRLHRLTGLPYDELSQAMRGLSRRERVRRRQDGPGLHHEWELVR